jgi:hypothetical protein
MESNSPVFPTTHTLHIRQPRPGSKSSQGQGQVQYELKFAVRNNALYLFFFDCNQSYQAIRIMLCGRDHKPQVSQDLALEDAYCIEESPDRRETQWPPRLLTSPYRASSGDLRLKANLDAAYGLQLAGTASSSQPGLVLSWLVCSPK